MSVQEATPPSRGFESQADFTRRVAPQLPSLFRVARRLAPSDDIAWDAVQETLLRVWLSGHLPSEPGPLNHLVRRSTLHQLRCLRRRRYHEDAAAARSEPCCDESPWLEGSEAPHVESLQAALERGAPGASRSARAPCDREGELREHRGAARDPDRNGPFAPEPSPPSPARDAHPSLVTRPYGAAPSSAASSGSARGTVPHRQSARSSRTS